MCHCFKGNDYTSAFYGIGQTRPFKAIQRNKILSAYSSRLVIHFSLTVNCFQWWKNLSECQWGTFYGKKKTPEPQQLPPTADALLCHCKRVSYATAIIKQSLVSNPVIPSLGKEFGWSIENGSLEIQWMLLPPAPDNVLNLINCSCKKGCKTNACTCKLNGLQCTELCHCTDECEKESL